MYLHRTLETSFLAAADHFPVLLVTGARQVGKTTFLRGIGGEKRTYANLDDPRVLELARRDPALFLQRFPAPVTIDEIQYAPGLLPHIKMAVDADPTPGRFWLTGSQQFHLMKAVSESLAGRVGILRLLGLSRREWDQDAIETGPFLPTPEVLEPRLKALTPLTLPALYERIWRGSFPALAVDPGLDRDLYYSSYVQTYLQRDVRDLARVGDEVAFLRFVRACAARTGQLLNMADLARDADVAPNTARHWLSILETSGLVFLLEPYHANVTRRLVKAPKLYFLDTGLCSYLLGARTAEDLLGGPMLGPMFETHVLGQIVRHFANQGRRREIYFYRDHHGHEVDFLLPIAGRFALIECKWAESPGAAPRGFSELESLVGPERILSKTIVTLERGSRRVSSSVTVADSITLDFLEGC